MEGLGVVGEGAGLVGACRFKEKGWGWGSRREALGDRGRHPRSGNSEVTVGGGSKSSGSEPFLLHPRAASGHAEWEGEKGRKTPAPKLQRGRSHDRTVTHIFHVACAVLPALTPDRFGGWWR